MKKIIYDLFLMFLNIGLFVLSMFNNNHITAFINLIAVILCFVMLVFDGMNNTKDGIL